VPVPVLHALRCIVPPDIRSPPTHRMDRLDPTGTTSSYCKDVRTHFLPPLLIPFPIVYPTPFAGPARTACTSPVGSSTAR
jgi:hypothetical protein